MSPSRHGVPVVMASVMMVPCDEHEI
jgi:hypothetical protein